MTMIDAGPVTEEELLLLLELDEPIPCMSSYCAGQPGHPATWECKMDRCPCITPGCNDARAWWDMLAREHPGETLCTLCKLDDQSIASYRPIRRRMS